MVVLVRWQYQPDGVPSYRATVTRARHDDPTVTFDHELVVFYVAEGSAASGVDIWFWNGRLADEVGRPGPSWRNWGVAQTAESAMRGAEDWLDGQPDIGAPPSVPAPRPEGLPALHEPNPGPFTMAPAETIDGPLVSSPPPRVVRNPWAPRVLRAGSRRGRRNYRESA